MSFLTPCYTAGYAYPFASRIQFTDQAEAERLDNGRAAQLHYRYRQAPMHYIAHVSALLAPANRYHNQTGSGVSATRDLAPFDKSNYDSRKFRWNVTDFSGLMIDIGLKCVD